MTDKHTKKINKITRLSPLFVSKGILYRDAVENHSNNGKRKMCKADTALKRIFVVC